MQTIGERLKKVREAHRMPQDRFAQMVGTTSSAISRYEGGLRSVPVPIIMSVCREFNVNRTWLETGEGEMLVETTSRTLDRIRKRYGASDTFRAMLDVYAAMTDAQQDAFEEYINMLARAVAAGQNPATVKPSVPTGSDIAETAAKEDDPEGELSGN